MRVAYIYPRSDTMGGAPIHLRDMTKRLIQEGHEAKVFIGGNGAFLENLDSHKVPFKSLVYLQRNPHPIKDIWAIWELYKTLKGYQPDLISTHCAKAGFIGRIAGKMLGIPTTYTPHCWPFTQGAPKAKVYLKLEKLVTPITKRIFLVAENERKEALQNRLCKDALMHTIHNGMLDISHSQRAAPVKSPPRLLMVARFEPQKDHATLFEALRSLKDLDWHLDLIGGGPLEDQFKNRAHDYGLADKIVFHGHSTRVAEIMSQSQIFLLITNWEGFPRSTLEGMRAGLPIVVTDVGGNQEAFVSGNEGYLVRYQDIKQLTIILKNLIQNPELRKEMGQSSRKSFEQHFTFEIMYQKYLEAYKEILQL